MFGALLLLTVLLVWEVKEQQICFLAKKVSSPVDSSESSSEPFCLKGNDWTLEQQQDKDIERKIPLMITPPSTEQRLGRARNYRVQRLLLHLWILSVSVLNISGLSCLKVLT